MLYLSKRNNMEKLLYVTPDPVNRVLGVAAAYLEYEPLLIREGTIVYKYRGLSNEAEG